MVTTSTTNGSPTAADWQADTPGLTVAQAAAKLGLSKIAVRHKIRRGTLPAFKDAEGEWRVPPAAVEAAYTTVYAARGTAAYAAVQEPVQAAEYDAAQGPVQGAAQGNEATLQETTAAALLTAALAAAQALEVRRLEETLALAREELEVRRREQETEREAHRREVDQLHTLLAQAHQLALPAPPTPAPTDADQVEPPSPKPQKIAAPEWPERRSWWQRLVFG